MRADMTIPHTTRYFLLSETALAYFTEENTRPTTTLKGGMLLTAIEDVREADGAEAVRPYMFIVVTPTRLVQQF